MRIGKLINIPFLFLCFVLSVQSSAQELPPNRWYNGEIFLQNDSTVLGKIKYDFSANTIYLKSRGDMTAYTPSRVKMAHFSDSTTQERTIEVKEYQFNKYLPIALFFEVLVDSTVKLYSREEIVYYSTSNMATQGFLNEVKPLLIYHYYFQKGESKIFAFKGSRNHVLRIMKNKKDQIKTYVKENKLKYSSRRDLITIFKYYNSLLI